jgi:F0F1-type ATP synthase membrane subunit b/b'
MLLAFENPLSQFGVNWYDFLSQTIAFLIIAWILNTFVFKTVMKTVAERRREAAEAAANQEKIRLELLAVEATRQEMLQATREQAELVISAAKAGAAELLSQEKIRCERLGAEMLAQAREDVLRDQARIKAELKTEIAEMVVNLTARLAQLNLTPADRERLVQSALHAIAAAPAQK